MVRPLDPTRTECVASDAAYQVTLPHASCRPVQQALAGLPLRSATQDTRTGSLQLSGWSTYILLSFAAAVTAEVRALELEGDGMVDG